MERYKVVRTLSSSFCTTCALVEDQWTGKRYFTKTLFLSNATKIHIHQFRMEIHALSLMDDPYIPHLIDVIEEADQIMIIETWIPGKTWMKMTEEKRQFRLKKRWILELMHLLENLHAHGFLYMDLKLENVMVYQDHVFLIDFNACLPIGSVQVYMSSPSNQTPESFTQKRKEVSTDIYALGVMLKPFYKLSLYRLWCLKCTRKDAKKRFRTMRSARFYFLLVGHIRKGVCLLLFILSVFFYNILFFQSVPHDLIHDYQLQHHQIQGGIQEKTQKLLSEWIVQNRLRKEVLSSEENARFFLEQSIFSRSQSIVSYFLENIPESMQKKMPLQIQLAHWITQQEHSYDASLLIRSLQAIQEEKDIFNKGLHILVVEQLLLEKEIILDKEGRVLLENIHKSWTINEIQENKELFKEVACIHAEYLLFLRSREIQTSSLPQAFIESFQKEETFMKLFELFN